MPAIFAENCSTIERFCIDMVACVFLHFLMLRHRSGLKQSFYRTRTRIKPKHVSRFPRPRKLPFTSKEWLFIKISCQFLVFLLFLYECLEENSKKIQFNYLSRLLKHCGNDCVRERVFKTGTQTSSWARIDYFLISLFIGRRKIIIIIKMIKEDASRGEGIEFHCFNLVMK